VADVVSGESGRPFAGWVARFLRDTGEKSWQKRPLDAWVANDVEVDSL
jgi:hypothetical protein